MTNLNNTLMLQKSSFNSWKRKLVACMLMFTVVNTSSLFAQKGELGSKKLGDIKRIYVPDEQLGALINTEKFGGILSRAEFEKLLAEEIKQSYSEEQSPRLAVIHSADYAVEVDGDRLVGTLTASISAFGTSWKECRFDLSGWNVESASLDGKPVAITRDGKLQNTLRVFLNTPGKQTLKLGVSAPLHAQGGDKAANVHLPGQASGEFRITLPAGKYLELGNNNLDRPAEADKSATYIIPIGGQKSVSLRITDRQKSSRGDVLTFASTAIGVKVFPSEMTWVAKTEIQVFGREIDRLTCLIPNTLEITAVESTGLESWELSDAADDDTKTLITLLYRQGFDGRRTVTFRGILSASPDSPWSVPTLMIPSVNSHTGAIVIQHPNNLRLQAIENVGVRAINAAAIPNAEASAETSDIRYQIWDEDFSLRFVASLKQQEVQAAMTNILDITQSGLNLYTTVSIETRLAPLFDFRMQLPADWEVASLSIEGTAVQWQTIPLEDGRHELRISLNPPLLPGQTRNLALFSHSQPKNWPVKGETNRIPIPEVRLPQVDMLEALYGVSAEKDFEVVTQELSGLDPAGQAEIQLLDKKLKPIGKSTRLGFTYQDTDFSGQLDVSRKPATLIAETLTYFRVDKENLFTRLEVILDITGGGYQELTVLVSEAADANLRFSLTPEISVQQQSRSAPNVRLVEQIPGEVADGFRPWTLRFDRYLNGNFRLMVDVRTEREEDATYRPVEIKLPVSQIVSGYIAVEGSSEEHVKINAVDSNGKPLGVVDPVDFPAVRYQPQKRVVAGYRYIHPGWELSVSVEEFDRSAVPTVIGHSATLTSVLSKAGQFQHQAQINFTAIGAQSLIVNLPQNASLWATLLDGNPVEVRQSAAGMQIPIAGLGADQHLLQLSYSTLAAPLDKLGEVNSTPPSLSVVDGQGQQQPVEILSQDWQLYLPEETLLISSDGRFEPVGRLFNSTFFSDLSHLLQLPSERSVVNRTWAIGWALVGLFLFWVVRRTAFVKGLSGKSTKVAALTVGLFAVLVVCVVSFVSLGLSSRQSADTAYLNEPTSNFTATTSEAFEMDFYDVAEDHMGGEASGYGGMEMATPQAEMQDRMKRRSRVPTRAQIPQNSTAETSDARMSAAHGAAIVDEHRSSVEKKSLSNKESQKSETIVGMPQSNSFADALDIPFRQGSFDLPAPSFGGFAPNTGAINSTAKPNAPPSPFGNTLPLLNDKSTSAPEQEESQASLRYDDKIVQTELGERSRFGRNARQSQRGRMSTGGLLSMTFDMQIPEGTRSQTFHYQGNGLNSEDVNLRVKFANRTTGQVLVWSIALGIALLGWWFRGTGLGIKVCWLGLTLLLPISIAWVVPAIWQLLLEGILYGGVASLLLWSVYWCAACCRCCCGWFSKGTCPASLLILGVLLSLGSANVATAAKPVPKVKQPPVVQTAPFVVIPYQSLDEIDAADRVWVPQALYRQLWKNAHPEDFPVPNGPVTASITEANYVGTVEKVGTEDQVAIQARWVIAVLTDDRVNVRLPIQGAAVASATIDGKQATLDVPAKEQIKIVLQGRGFHIVDAKLTTSANISGKVGEFRLDLLPVAAGLFHFKLPQPKEDLRVRVDGLTRAYRRVQTGDSTVIQFPIDRGGKKTLSWYPAAQQGGQNQFVQVETAIAATVNDSGLNVSHGFQARVRQGAINDMTFSVPEQLSVRDISGQDIGGWEMNAVDAGKELKVFFRREINDQTEFLINLFQELEIGDDGTRIAIPTIAPQGVSRETVQLALHAANHLKLRVAATSGLSQIDTSRYQPVVSLQQPASPPLATYRSSSRPLELNVSIERRAAEAKTIVEHGVHIARRKQMLATRIVWQLTGSPRRRVDVAIPDGYLPISVVCAGSSDWYVHGNGTGKILSIEFPTPKLGRIEAGLEGHIAKQPDDQTVELNLPHPMEANGQTATLGIWLDSGYQAAISQTGDWDSIRPQQLSGHFRKLDPTPLQFAFRTTKDDPQNVILSMQTAVPKLTTDTVALIAVSDATIDYGVTLRWKISQAAADTFTFTTPAWLGNLEINGPAIREIQSEEIDGDRKRWTVSLIDPVREQYLLSIAATIPAPLNQQVETPFVTTEIKQADDSFQPVQVQQQYAILVNLSGNQLVPVDLEQLESIPLEQIPIVVHQELVQQAMEMTRVRTGKIPSWKIQRMEELSVSKAVVLAAHLETVLELDGSWRTLATYGIRNRGKQFLALSVPENSRILSVFVRGRPSRTVLTTINEQNMHLVALPQTSAADLSFDIKILLAGRFERSLKTEFALRGKRLQIPSPDILSQQESEEFGVPVTQTLWTIHLPEEIDAKAISGVAATNLTPHSTDAWLAVEQQTLERIRSDVSEMTRLAKDKSISKSRRNQANKNLRSLNLSLHEFSDNYLSNTVNDGKSIELREQLLDGNRFLQKQVEKAVEEVEPELAEVEHFGRQSGRAYIASNSIEIFTNNGGAGIQLDVNGDQATTFNFLDVKPNTISEAVSGKNAAKGAVSRSKLKSQIAGQQLQLFGAQNGNGVPQLNNNFHGNTSNYDSDMDGIRVDLSDINGGMTPSLQSSTAVGTTTDLNSAIDELLASGFVNNQSAQQSVQSRGESRPWSTAGGLSIQMELPKNSKTLSFSKVGGGPVLTLNIQSAETNQKLLGFGWCVLSLVAGCWLLKRLRKSRSTMQTIHILCNLAIIVGLIGFFVLPNHMVWTFFWIFCLGAVVRIVLDYSRKPSIKTA